MSTSDARITLSQEYPILAIATERPKSKSGYSSITHIFDPNGDGYFKSRTIYDESSSHPTAMIYATMAADNNILASSTVADATRVQMKLSITYSSAPADPTLKLYFAGTFKTADEAKAYYNTYFGY